MRAARRDALCALALAGLSFAVFSRALGCGFTNFDDGTYVAANPYVLTGPTPANTAWSWTTFRASNWHPLTWLSLQLDATLYGPGPRGFHFTNVLLHAANAALAFLALRALTGTFWRSAVAAALFAVHPLRVESVAWIAERKDVLSVFFGLLALVAYARYAVAPSIGRYVLVAIALVLSLLSKPTLVTMPCLLLVLDWWPLERGKLWGRSVAGSGDPATTPARDPATETARDVASAARAPRVVAGSPRVVAGSPDPATKPARTPHVVAGSPDPATKPARVWIQLAAEKLPLFILCIASAVITLVAQQRGGSVAALEHLSLIARLQNSCVAYAAYLGSAAWPLRLTVYYNLPLSGWPTDRVAVSVLVVAGLTGLAIWQRRRRPYLLAGWLWYTGTLIPVIGIVQVGDQAYADRYTYFPFIGVSLAVVWAAAEALGRARLKVAVAVAAGLVAWLAILSWYQIGYWQDGLTLWSRNLQMGGPDEKTLNNLGEMLLRHGQTAEAIQCFTEAVDRYPESAVIHSNLGTALIRARKFAEARSHLQASIQLDPKFFMARVNLGDLLSNERKYSEAVESYRAALDLQPDGTTARTKLGAILWLLGQDEEALTYLTEAARLGPNDSTAHYNLGLAFSDEVRYAEAADEFAIAARLNSRSFVYRLALAAAFDRAGKDAAPLVREIAENDSHWAEGVAREAQRFADSPGATPRDARHAAEVIRLACKFSGAANPRLLDGLAAAYARAGMFPDAVAAGEKALAAAEAMHQPELARTIASHLAGYRAGRVADPSPVSDKP